MRDGKFIAGLLLGALAGTALVLFLNSAKGKELINDLKEGADNIQEDLGNLADELLQKVRSSSTGGNNRHLKKNICRKKKKIFSPSRAKNWSSISRTGYYY